MSSEKDNETFGQKVTLYLLFCVLCLGVVTYTFNLFEPHFVSACGTSQALIDPSET